MKYAQYIKGFLFGTMISLCFLGMSMLMAWTSPTGNPPESNVSAPINISSQGQIKQGGLMLNTAGAAVGLVVSHGNVGIGVESPTEKLDVDGQINAQDVCLYNGFCLSDLIGPDIINNLFLIHDVHTKCECLDAGGTVVDSGVVNYSQCQFDADTCPDGWERYLSWSTTSSNCCGMGCGSCNWRTNCCSGGCSGQHGWSQSGVERATCYTWGPTCADWCCECYASGSVSATITQVGCY